MEARQEAHRQGLKPSTLPWMMETRSALMTKLLNPYLLPPAGVELIETDGVPLESDWHRLAMNLLIDIVIHRMHGRNDYFVGGNMFIYFNNEGVRNRDFRGPDFFFVRGRPLEPARLYWAVWEEEGKFPDVIMEFNSPSTIKDDHGIKKDIYEKVFRTHEYYTFDPAKDTLKGWRLVDDKYEPIVPNERGWLWCEELGLWLGTWHGKFQAKEKTYPRFYHENGELALTDAEDGHLRASTQAKLANAERKRREQETKRAENEKQRAEAERQRADDEKQRAEAERRRADAEKQRAEATAQRALELEAEVARLRAQLQKPQS